MTPRLAGLLALCLAAAPASALPDWGRGALAGEPEFEAVKGAFMGSPGVCAVLKYRDSAAVPAPARPAVRALQDGATMIVGATNQCARFWDKVERLLDAADAAGALKPGACVPPAADLEIFVPAGEAPAELRAAAAEIDEVGRAVGAALKSQREAFAEIVKHLGGRGCRELTAAFEELRSAERGLYFEYRRDALRDAAMKGLRWKSVTSAK